MPNIENGTLKERVTALEKTVTEVDCKVDELTRAIYGHNSTPGMLSDQKNLAEKMDDIKKIVWIILAIVAGIAVEGVYLAIQHVFATTI